MQIGNTDFLESPSTWLSQRRLCFLCLLGVGMLVALPAFGQSQSSSSQISTPYSIVTSGTTVSTTSFVTAGPLSPSGAVSIMADGTQLLGTAALLGGYGSNLLPYSASGSAWAANASTIIPNSANAPDGSQNAFTVQFNGLQNSSATQDVTAPLNTLLPYTFSVWLRVPSGSLSTALSVQDQTGTLVAHSVSVTTAWQRFFYTGYLPYTATVARVTIGGQGSLSAINGGGILEVWGAQLEQQVPSPYLSTSGSSASASVTNLNYCSAEATCYDFWGQGDVSWRLIGDGDIEDAALNTFANFDVAPDGSIDTSELSFQGDNTPTYFAKTIGPVLPGKTHYVFSVWLRSKPGIPAPTGQTIIGITDADLVGGPTPGGWTQSTSVQLNYTCSQQSLAYVTNEWQRFSVAADVPPSVQNVAVYIGGSDMTNQPGDYEIWGAQVEANASANQPPGPYVGTQGTPKNVSMTNLLPFSEAPSWTSTGGASVTVDSYYTPTAPEGALLISGASSANVVQSGGISATDQPYTFSVWLQGAQPGYACISLANQSGPQVNRVISYTTNWSRYEVTGYLPGNSTTVLASVGGMCGQSAPMTDSFHFWGAQLSAVQPGGYVATTGAAATGATSTATVSFKAYPLLTPGTHQLTTVYSGDSYTATSTSNPVSLTVQAENPTTTVTTMQLTCLPADLVSSPTAACTVQVPQDATGQVTFSNDGTPVSTIALASGQATYIGAFWNASVGVHQLTASYTGDTNFQAATQVKNYAVTTPIDTTMLGAVVYSYSIPTGGFDLAGNIVAYTDSVNGNWTAQYDNLNRLSSATSQVGNAPTQYLCWNYDSFGNRLGQVVQDQQCIPSSMPVSYTAPNNQLQNGLVQYDAAGNMISDGLTSYLYDGEGRLCAMGIVVAGFRSMYGYLYDAAGTRVAKGTLTQWSCDLTQNGFTPTSISVQGPDGKTEAVYAPGSAAPQRTQVYAEGKLLATADASSKFHFHQSDWLGTRRVQTDASGATESSFTNRPFGDTNESSFLSAGDATPEHFTGQEHDVESGLDYFRARYSDNEAGRFISPDSSVDQHKDNPQSLNLYSYVRNNPLSLDDPTGHYACGSSDNAKACADMESNIAILVSRGVNPFQAMAAAPLLTAGAANDYNGADTDPNSPLAREVGAAQHLLASEGDPDLAAAVINGTANPKNPDVLYGTAASHTDSAVMWTKVWSIGNCYAVGGCYPLLGSTARISLWEHQEHNEWKGAGSQIGGFTDIFTPEQRWVHQQFYMNGSMIPEFLGFLGREEIIAPEVLVFVHGVFSNQPPTYTAYDYAKGEPK